MYTVYEYMYIHTYVCVYIHIHVYSRYQRRKKDLYYSCIRARNFWVSFEIIFGDTQSPFNQHGCLFLVSKFAGVF